MIGRKSMDSRSVDLRKATIQEAWYSKEFEDFRSYLKNACPDCSYHNECMGGCPICPEIVLCRQNRNRM